MVSRRQFLSLIGGLPWAAHAWGNTAGSINRGSVTLFLCGDVMTGRGIDQILPHRSAPAIYEPYLRDARDYLDLAERRSGPIPRPVGLDYVWGDALAVLARIRPAVRIVNLETAITTHDRHVPKGINYRMHPGNTGLLNAAGIDCCTLANNHVLDWGPQGLAETLAALQGAGIRTAGAGQDLAQAQAPATMPLPGRGRVLVYGFGSEYSGIDRRWAATRSGPGINLLPDLSDATADAIGEQVVASRNDGDIVVASIHWGGNWGYEIPEDQRRFARRLIDRASVDIVHGHSSHHVKGIEVYRDRLILYGCGDLLNDYEGIRGHEAYRPELGLMYFPTVDCASGRLQAMTLVPMRVRRFRLQRATTEETDWLARLIDREGQSLGTAVSGRSPAGLALRWQDSRRGGD